MIEKLAAEIRRKILKTAWQGRSGHIASSLSATEILVELYFDQILRYRPAQPNWEKRDRFILSKGHASLLLYHVLAKAGYFAAELLGDYCKPGTTFGSHPTIEIPGVEASTGALGHGYSFAGGIALAAKMDEEDFLTYVLLGDGECQEGSIWETAMSVSKFHLTNLVTIVDCNGLQATDFTNNIMNSGNFADKWKAFGFEVQEIDGNDIDQVKEALSVRRDCLPKIPKVVLAHTVKGKGIPMIENNPQWHSRIPNEEELNVMLCQLGMTREEFECL